MHLTVKPVIDQRLPMPTQWTFAPQSTEKKRKKPTVEAIKCNDMQFANIDAQFCNACIVTLKDLAINKANNKGRLTQSTRRFTSMHHHAESIKRCVTFLCDRTNNLEKRAQDFNLTRVINNKELIKSGRAVANKRYAKSIKVELTYFKDITVEGIRRFMQQIKKVVNLRQSPLNYCYISPLNRYHTFNTIIAELPSFKHLKSSCLHLNSTRYREKFGNEDVDDAAVVRLIAASIQPHLSTPHLLLKCNALTDFSPGKRCITLLKWCWRRCNLLLTAQIQAPR